MTALLIRRRRPIGEPPELAETIAATFDGTSGAARIIQALADLEFDLGVPHQLVIDPAATPGGLRSVDAGLFGLAILGSHLVNLPDDGLRSAYLALARRHIEPGGALFIEHHPIDWAETADEVRATPGLSRVGMEEVKRDPPFVTAVSVYDIGGHEVRQPFRARVLSDAELDEVLAGAGLRRVRRLSPTWLEAGPAAQGSMHVDA